MKIKGYGMNTRHLTLAMPTLSTLSFSSGMSETEKANLAKKAQNPIATMISVPFQNNTSLNIGPDEQTQIQFMFPK